METKKKILIVDDEPINLEFFDLMLSKLGFHVEKAEDGQQALHAVRRVKPDLILLDNMMPVMSGWEVTRALKTSNEYADYREIPVIMFSALDDVKDKVEGFELGIEDYITKPFNFSEVLARIRSVLRNHELINQLEKRERRIAIVEELNGELIGFSNGLKAPLEAIRKQATVLATGGEAQKNAFSDMDASAAKLLAELESISGTVERLKAEEKKLKALEIEIKTLRSELRKVHDHKSAI